MNDFVQSFSRVALSVGEMLTPVLKESKFKETGVLTPEEFVAAGDHLVNLCPTWAWSAASDPSKTKDFLPEKKQFLITRHVPCHQRCDQMDYDTNLEKLIYEKTEDGGVVDEWVDTHHFEVDKQDGSTQSSSNTAKTIESPKPKPELNRSANANEEDDDDDEDGPAVDMDAFLESGGLEEEDPNRFVYAKNVKELEEAEEMIEQTRTYDLHITYDKYYQVPRFWLLGYNEQGRPLSVKQMKEDFSQEHADRTITLEAHPQMSGLQLATIHPCRHAAVMKRLIEQFSDNGKVLSVLDYLFVFLKFVQAVIPTVEYDYTRSIQF